MLDEFVHRRHQGPHGVDALLEVRALLLGELQLGPIVLGPLGGPTSTSSADVAEVSFPATDTGLKGVTLHIQGLINPVDLTLSDSFTSLVSPSFK